MRVRLLLPTLVLFGTIAACVPAPVTPALSHPVRAEKGSAPFRRSGQVMVVEATLNRRVKANLLVDTGSDLTIIPSAAAKELEIILHTKLPTIRLQTMADSVRVPLVVLDSLEVGGMEVTNVTVAVHDSPIFDPRLPGPPGLLGRDFLSHFRVQIDLTEGFLRLEKRE